MGGGASVVPSRPSSASADCNKPLLLPFPKHGVRLDYYQEFIAACGGRDSLKGLTTTEVNENFVKPATAHFQSSYCDMLSSQRHAAVGLLATVFTSHAWKYLFLDVIDALLYHFQDEPDMATDGVDAMNKMLATINAEKSEC